MIKEIDIPLLSKKIQLLKKYEINHPTQTPLSSDYLTKYNFEAISHKSELSIDIQQSQNHIILKK